MVVMIIEHCEPAVSEWLYLEYKNTSEIWDNLIFTGVKSQKDKEILSKIGRVEKSSFYELFKPSELIILDPLADRELCTEDFASAKALVVGGILGYFKPKGRTKKLITTKSKGSRARNLGKIQLSIDSAVLVSKMIYLGMKLEEIEITSEVEIKSNENESIVLPYGYVVFNEKVLITPGLIEYLTQ